MARVILSEADLGKIGGDSMKGYVPTPILPERYLINKQGQIYSLRSNKHIATRLDRYGYVRVNLYEGTKNHTVTVHRLLALAFIENDDPENKLEVNHIDGDKLNNNLDNLEWVTSARNQQHAFELGLQKHRQGEANGMATHTEENVIDVCERLNRGQANAEIRRETGYTISFIEKIKYGETWTHITEQYGIIPKSERATTIQR